MNFRNKIINAFKWSSFETIINVILQPLTLVALAWFLGPEEFGKRAILAIIMGLAQQLANFGLSQAIIQKDKINNLELDSIFWLNLFIGVILFTFTNVFSNQICMVFGEENLKVLIFIASFIFIFEPIDLVFRAILQKEMKFKKLQSARIIKSIIENFTMILFAIIGFGATSFVIGKLTGVIVLTILMFLIFYNNKEWLPGFRFSFSAAKPYYNFGIYVTLKSLLNYFVANIDEIMISRLIGTEALGIYNFGKKIVDQPRKLFSRIFAKVNYPVFSKYINENKLKKFESTYLKFINYMTKLSYPLFGLLLVSAPFLIPVIFGMQWQNSIIIIQIFAVKAFFDLISSGFASNALYALNKPNLVFNVDLVLSPIRILLIYLGSLIGIEYVAIAFLIIVVITVITLQIILNKNCNISMFDFFNNISNILITTIFIGSIVILINSYLLKINDLTNFILCSIFYITFFLIYYYYFERNFTLEISNEIKNYFNN